MHCGRDSREGLVCCTAQTMQRPLSPERPGGSWCISAGPEATSQLEYRLQLEMQKRRETEKSLEAAIFQLHEMEARSHSDETRRGASLALLNREKELLKAHLNGQIDQLSAELARTRTAFDFAAEALDTEKRTLDRERETTKELISKHADRIFHMEKEAERTQIAFHEREKAFDTEKVMLMETLRQLATEVALAQKRAATAEADVIRLQDVNHLLAVRVSAVAAELEARAMENEQLQLLRRQNEEMEKQLFDLRRVVSGFMSR